MAATTTELGESLWIHRYHRPEQGAAGGPTPRLLCCPHAGGSASYFYPLSGALAPEVEVLAVQYPGRQNRVREARAESIAELADGTYRALMSLPDADGPLALFGHSMGSLVALEVCRRLQRDGIAAPVRLFVSGRRAPTELRKILPSVSELDDEGLLALLKRNGGTHQSILDDPELQALFLPIIRDDYRTNDSYRFAPGPPLDCPITALTGDNDPAVTVDEAASWEQQGTGRFDLRVYSGGHFYLEDHQAELTELLRTEILKPGS